MSIPSFVKRIGIGRIIKKFPTMERLLGLVYYGIFRKPYFSRMVDVSIGGAGVCRLDYRFGHYNYESFGGAHNGCFHVWIELCRRSRVILDIGAHIGLYALIACREARGGLVYAFEPSEGNLEYLKRHVAYNGLENMITLPLLLGETDRDDVPFFERPGPDAMNSIGGLKKSPGYRRVQRRQVSLDSCCEEKGLEPDLIKMDVEGAELNVFRGALRTLRRHRPVIVLSVHPSRLQAMGQQVEDLERLLGDLDYTMENSDGAAVEHLYFGEYILRPRNRP
ncbi:MAG: FkbM family methyltransferase [Elusimicrobiota bacterium]|jgi:FkbM family methyltransferase